MNLSDYKQNILKEFRTKYIKGHGPISNGDNYPQEAESWIEAEQEDFENWLWSILQSYGEEVAKQTREEVIEEIQKHVHEQAIESQTDVNIEFDLYLDQLRSTQPKEEGNIQQLPDTFVKGRHTGSTIAVKTFSIKLTDKDKR